MVSKNTCFLRLKFISKTKAYDDLHAAANNYNKKMLRCFMRLKFCGSRGEFLVATEETSPDRRGRRGQFEHTGGNLIIGGTIYPGGKVLTSGVRQKVAFQLHLYST